MSMISRTLALVPLVALQCAFGPAGRADDARLNESHWRLALTEQLKAEQGCKLNEVVTYHEIPLGADMAVDARVSCVDGREFDVSRTGGREKFKIELCKPTVC